MRLGDIAKTQHAILVAAHSDVVRQGLFDELGRDNNQSRTRYWIGFLSHGDFVGSDHVGASECRLSKPRRISDDPIFLAPHPSVA